MSSWMELLWSASWKACFPVIAGGIWAMVARRPAAAARHAVWCLALAAMLVLPFLGLSLPSWPVRVPVAQPVLTFAVDVTAGAPAAGVQAAPPGASPARASNPLPWVLLVWAAGALAMSMRIAAGVLAARRFIARCLPFDCAGLPVEAGARVVASEAASMPLTFGRTVVLPAAARDWNPDRLRAVLAHEMAHVRRRDTLTQILGQSVCALYWFHPLAWFAYRRMQRERERACDDQVLALGAAPSDYAGHLLDIARSLSLPRAAGPALAFARRSQLEGRLLAILHPDRNRKAPGRAALAGLAAAGLILIVPLAAMRPQAASDPPASGAAIETAATYAQLDALGERLLGTRDYALAARAYRRSLDLREKAFGADHAEYAAGLLNLARVLRRQGSPEAAPLFAQALPILERTGAAPAQMAETLHQAAMQAASRKDYTAAAALLDRALEALQAAGREASPEAAGVLLAQGLVEEKMGRREDAEANYRRAQAVAAEGSAELALALELAGTEPETRRMTRTPDEGQPVDAPILRRRAAEIRKARVIEISRRSGVYGSSASAVRIGGGVMAPRLVHKVEPAYSEEARLALYEGTVVLQLVVGVDGRAHDLALDRSIGFGLDEQAALAIGQWQFDPAMRDGRPVDVFATVEVNFRLM